MDRPAASCCSSHARSMARTLVRVADGTGPCSVPPMELHPGEEIVFEGHPSWRAVLSFYVGGVAIVAVAAAIGALVSGAAIAILAGAVVLAIVILAGLIKRQATRYVITSERLHIRHGILSKTTQETR